MPQTRTSPPAEERLRPDSPHWPARLRQLAEPPAELRVRGALPSWDGAIAVVGTRYADDGALELAQQLGAALAAEGRAVISGGAVGVDAAAHRGALEVGGPTVAVLASGFDPPFPRSHEALFAQIAACGALISEREDGYPSERWTFLSRNRLIAALAEAVVVVQAPLRSGALSTAAAAARLKKPIFSVPHAPWEARGLGCLELLRRGALICTSPRDVLSKPAHRTDLGFESVRLHDEKPIQAEGLDEDARTV
jgi:DNA processing protein